MIDLPDVKSDGWHTPVGQKKSWIFWGVGVIPFGRRPVRVSEKPPM